MNHTDISEDKEKTVVKKDIVQTLVVNLVFLILLVGLYYWNKANGFPLDHYIANLI
jgi:hypothetical protein